MYTMKINREQVQPGQMIRLDGLTYTASAQRNGRLYAFREMPGDLRMHRDCTYTTAREVELIVDERNFRQHANGN